MDKLRVLGPALLVASGILVTSALAAMARESEWPVFAAAAIMALVILGADMLSSRLRGKAIRPSFAGLLLAAAFLTACGLIALTKPAQLALMIPILGAGVAMPVILDTGRGKECRDR